MPYIGMPAAPRLTTEHPPCRVAVARAPQKGLLLSCWLVLHVQHPKRFSGLALPALNPAATSPTWPVSWCPHLTTALTQINLCSQYLEHWDMVGIGIQKNCA